MGLILPVDGLLNSPVSGVVVSIFLCFAAIVAARLALATSLAKMITNYILIKPTLLAYVNNSE